MRPMRCANAASAAATDTFLTLAKANGADGAILAAPAYICASEGDIERFFLDVADATDLPLGVYNNPPRVKTDLHWDNLIRIFKHPNYIVHKESTTRVGQVAQVGGDQREGRRGAAGFREFAAKMNGVAAQRDCGHGTLLLGLKTIVYY